MLSPAFPASAAYSETTHSLLLLLLGIVLWTVLLLIGWLIDLPRSSPWWVVLTIVYGSLAYWLYVRADRVLRLPASNPLSPRQFPAWSRMWVTNGKKLCHMLLRWLYWHRSVMILLGLMVASYWALNSVSFWTG